MEFTDYAYNKAIKEVTGKDLQSEKEINDFYESLEDQLKNGELTKEDLEKIQILTQKYLCSSDLEEEFEKKFFQGQ